MPAFAYQAVDATGRRVRGAEEAVNPVALQRVLEGRGMTVLRVDEQAAEAAAARGGFRFGRRRTVLDVTRAIAALLPAGMPLARALATATHVAGADLRDALTTVRTKVERGGSVAQALSEHPTLFSPLYIGILRAGERSGDLAAAFKRLADQLEREEKIRAKLLSLSIYPLVLATAGGVAVLVLLFFVLPRFVDLLEGAGASLPRSTALLLGVSTFVRGHWILVLVGLVAAIGGATWVAGTPEGRRAAAGIALRLPLLKPLRQNALAARFGRLLGVLLGGGAPLLVALDDTAASIGDPVAAADVARIRARVREGVTLHRALAEGALWPTMFAQLVAVGEESSRLQEFLLKAADMFEERTERATQRLMSLAEPAMILVFGGIVAFVALSLLQAIYGVNASAFK